MATKKKAFDCVEMKRRGAERIQAEIAGMTQAEELAFWQNGTAQLQQRQAENRSGKTRSDLSHDTPIAASV